MLPDAPVLATGAGHDAGILANAGIPATMLFVRNPTGISHSPAEFAERDDCLAGVRRPDRRGRRAGRMTGYWARLCLDRRGVAERVRLVEQNGRWLR